MDQTTTKTTRYSLSRILSLLAFLFALVPSAFCIFLYVKYNNLETRFDLKVMPPQSTLIRNKRGAKRNQMSAIHLDSQNGSEWVYLGKNNNNAEYTKKPRQRFEWQDKPKVSTGTRHLIFNKNENAIQILKSGIYFLYAQTEVSGFIGYAKVRTCSVETVKRSSTNDVQTLMLSQRTQNILDSPEVRRLDTVGHQGIFNLSKGDLIYLKPLDVSAECKYQLASDRTFLGGFKLA
ncbi:DgyrCDS13195 [Dimorphilus gyrociliatus]|uniref:DgyrCDS13195 n=1 Tax=Dimorphilus gyrociliatus TaxID=2664684 RepID=A0A7I8W9Y2_9ANNE|nr:DgyrCDS13195 [Dimorphilus gyrociliatus]